MRIILRVLHNSFFLTLAMIADRAADFLLVVFLARFFGVDGVGEYFLVISTLYLFQNLVNYGLVQLATRETAKDTTQVLNLLTYLSIIGISLGCLVTVIMLFVIPLLQYSDTVSLGLTIVAFSLLPGTLRGVVEAIFTAVERMEHIAWVTGLGGLFRSGISLGVLWVGQKLEVVFAVTVATQWIVVLVYLLVILRLYGRPKLRFSWIRLWPLLRPALVFSAMSIFLVGANNINAVILSKLGSIKDVGLYAAAFKLGQGVILFRPILMRSMFPSMVQLADNNTQLRRMTQHMLRLLIVFLAPVSILSTLFAKDIIRFVYGVDFAGAVFVLQILGWSILLSYLSVGLFRVILAIDKEQVALTISIVSMLINMTGDFLLIPLIGATGAALAGVVSIVGALLLALGWIHFRLFTIEFKDIIGRPLLSAILVGLIVYTAWRISPFGSLIILALSYVPILVLTGVFSITDLLRVFRFTQSRVSRLVSR